MAFASKPIVMDFVSVTGNVRLPEINSQDAERRRSAPRGWLALWCGSSDAADSARIQFYGEFDYSGGRP